MDMNSVNFLVVALFGTLLIAVGQLPSYPIRDAPVVPNPPSCSALDQNELREQAGEAAASSFLSEDAVRRQPAPSDMSEDDSFARPERSTSIQNVCAENCQWQLLNFVFLVDGVYYTPVTGVGFGQTLLYQSIYACRCRSPGGKCGGQCLTGPAHDPWGNCNYFQQIWLPNNCKCPIQTCADSFSWHRTLVWQLNTCDRPVWKNVKIPTGCCCKVTQYTTGNTRGK